MDDNVPKALLASTSGILAGIATCPHSHDPVFVAITLAGFFIGALGTWVGCLTKPINKD